MKKLFSLLLSFFVITNLCAYDFEVDGYYYNIISDNSVEITYGEYEYAGSIVIPNMVFYEESDYVVEVIGESAFSNCSALTEITIPEGVTSIGYEAFEGCFALDTIHVLATTPPTLDEIYYDIYPVCIVPCGALSDYQLSEWADYMKCFTDECGETTCIDCNDFTTYEWGTEIENTTKWYRVNLTDMYNKDIEVRMTIPIGDSIGGFLGYYDCESIQRDEPHFIFTEHAGYEVIQRIVSITEASKLFGSNDVAYIKCIGGSVQFNHIDLEKEGWTNAIRTKIGEEYVIPVNTKKCFDITEIKALERDVDLTITNTSNTTIDYLFLFSSDLLYYDGMKVGMYQSLAAGETLSLTPLIAEYGVHSFQLSGTGELMLACMLNTTNCDAAPLLDWQSTINSSELTNEWYKLDVSSIFTNQNDFTLSIDNNYYEDGWSWVSEENIALSLQYFVSCDDILPVRTDTVHVNQSGVGTLHVDYNDFIKHFPNNTSEVYIRVKKIGKCGNNVYYEYKDYTLTIYGKGEMYDSIRPYWWDVNDLVSSIIVKEGVTRIGDEAFSGFYNLQNVTIASSVKEIGNAAFYQGGNFGQPWSITCYAIIPPTLGENNFEDIYGELTIYVPPMSVILYEEADVWKNFTILPIPDYFSPRCITITYPDQTNANDYKNMQLVLSNINTNQQISYTTTEKNSYTFYDLKPNTVWSFQLCNTVGDVFGQLDSIIIPTNDTTIAFKSLHTPHTITLSVLTPDKKDITEQVNIIWTDSNNTIISRSEQLTQTIESKKLYYQVQLPQELATQYVTPKRTEYIVTDSANSPVCVLDTIPNITLVGSIVDDRMQTPIQAASISATLTFAPNLTLVIHATADKNGAYSITIPNVATSLSFSADGFLSQTLVCDSLLSCAKDSVFLEDVLLECISGTVLNLNLSYITSVVENEIPDTTNWYNDYNNIEYTIYNNTKQRAVTQFVTQHPQIVLLDSVEDNDELYIKAHSKKASFMPVETQTTVINQEASVSLVLSELGKIQASYTTSNNSATVGLLYNAKGELVRSNDYTKATLTIDNLTDGSYILVSMGYNQRLGAISHFNQLSQIGLVENQDYLCTPVEVTSGKITTININAIPTLDSGKFGYTDTNTSFTANKTNIVAGNYLTLTGRVIFKPEYADKVSDVQLIFDMPESCSFITGSVMIGNNINYTYHIDNNRLTIPILNHSDKVRFCITPTQAGEYTPSALIQFKLNGNTITQPIGAALFAVEDLSIDVPSTTAKTSIFVSGQTIGKSKIEIYDNNTKIGETTALANGKWNTTCELNKPYNLSVHSIHAKVTTPHGINLQSATKECRYDANAIEIKTVTMLFRSEKVIFDFENNRTNQTSYNANDDGVFTFIIDFTNNDTTLVSDVNLFVYTNSGRIQTLPAWYDSKKGKWITTHRFNSNNLPVNVNVDFMVKSFALIDRDHFSQSLQGIDEHKEWLSTILHDVDSLYNHADWIAEKDSIQLANQMAITEKLINAYENGESYQYIDSLYNLLGIDIAPIDIPDNADSAWLKEILQYGDSLLENPIDTIDNKYLNELLHMADSLTNDTTIVDIISAFRGALTDSLLIVAEDGEELLIYKTPLNELDAQLILDADSTHLNMTYGSPIVIYTTLEDNFVVVDSLRNEAMVVYSTSATSNIKHMIRLLRSGEENGFIVAMNEARQNIEWLINSLVSFCKSWNDEYVKKINNLNKTIENLRSQQVIVLGQSAGAKIKMDELEQQIRILKNQKVVDMELYQQTKLQIQNLEKQRTKYLNEWERLNKLNKDLTKKLNKMLPALRTTTAAFSQIREVWDVINGLQTTRTNILYAVNDRNQWMNLIKLVQQPCEEDPLAASALARVCQDDWTDIAWNKGYYPACALTGVTTVINAFMMVKKDLKYLIGLITGVLTDFMNNTATSMFNNASIASANRYPIRYKEYLSLECNKEEKEDDDENNPPTEEEPTPPKKPTPIPPQVLPPVEPIIDPSGYVYEGVPSNRLEGVTATCYYKEIVEDIYGDLHENIVLWNAEDYGQENPLFTDENGMYRWDVPQGLWQVKFEKEGYETTYSDWFPVPPPQLDVNVAMKQNIQPTILTARAYEEAVEIQFDKYMLPELLTVDNIVVMVDSTIVNGTIQLIDEELTYNSNNLKYASLVRFVPSKAFTTTEVTLHVKNFVKSYAGIRMQEDFIQTLTVEQEVKNIICDSLIQLPYGKTAEINIQALPVSAAAGKVLKVHSSSSMILQADTTVVLNEEGRAAVTLSGELPGTVSLTFTLDEYNISTSSLVQVTNFDGTVAVPVASIASGATIPEGTSVELSCETKNAVIYYTTDGSCPCDTTESAVQYNGQPIVINQNTTLKTIAYVDTYESEIATFHYTVLLNPIDTTICANESFVWNNIVYESAGEYIDTLDIGIATVSLHKYKLTIPPVVTPPIVRTGEAIDVTIPTAEIQAHIAAETWYAPNAEVAWYIMDNSDWAALTAEPVKAGISQVTLKYAVATDCGNVESDDMVIDVIPTSVENTHTQSPTSDCQKILYEDHIYILRDGKIYSIMGQEM